MLYARQPGVVLMCAMHAHAYMLNPLENWCGEIKKQGG
jgi:hypothetical protein